MIPLLRGFRLTLIYDLLLHGEKIGVTELHLYSERLLSCVTIEDLYIKVKAQLKYIFWEILYIPPFNSEHL